MDAARVRGRRRLSAGIAAAVLVAGLAALPTSVALASTGTVRGDQRAAAVQTVLDRVLGPGSAVVVVSDTVRTSTSSTTAVRWGSGVAGSVVASRTVAPGTGSARSTTQQDLVGGTTTSTVTPAGALVRQDVTVAVDRAHLGTVRLATIRRLVATAAGLTPARGDRLSVVTAAFVKAPAVPAPVPPGPWSIVVASAVPLLWTAGGVLALGIVGAAVGGRRRAGTTVARP